MALYQETHRATCHSTARRSVQAGPPSLMASVLNSPMVDSHSALSSASPTVPIDPAMPWSSSSAVNATDVYWLPASEWWINPFAVPTRFGDPSSGQRLMQGVGDQGCLLARRHPPAQDPAGEDVDDERDVHEPGHRPHVGEVSHPQFVRCGGIVPAALDQVRVPRRGVVPARGPRAVPTTDRAADPADAHQPAHLVPADLDPGARTACHILRTPYTPQFSWCRVTSGVDQVRLLERRRRDRARLVGVVRGWRDAVIPCSESTAQIGSTPNRSRKQSM